MVYHMLGLKKNQEQAENRTNHSVLLYSYVSEGRPLLCEIVIDQLCHVKVKQHREGS